MARWLIFLCQGQDMAGQTYSKLDSKIIAFSKNTIYQVPLVGVLCFVCVSWQLRIHTSFRKAKKTIRNVANLEDNSQRYISLAQKSSTISCDTWIVWEMVQKIIPENEKTDTLKPWSELDLIDFLDTWWCLARMILLYKQVPLYWSEVYLYFHITRDLRCWTLWACLGENCGEMSFCCTNVNLFNCAFISLTCARSAPTPPWPGVGADAPGNGIEGTIENAKAWDASLSMIYFVWTHFIFGVANYQPVFSN